MSFLSPSIPFTFSPIFMLCWWPWDSLRILMHQEKNFYRISLPCWPTYQHLYQHQSLPFSIAEISRLLSKSNAFPCTLDPVSWLLLRDIKDSCSPHSLPCHQFLILCWSIPSAHIYDVISSHFKIKQNLKNFGATFSYLPPHFLLLFCSKLLNMLLSPIFFLSSLKPTLIWVTPSPTVFHQNCSLQGHLYPHHS